MTEIWFYPLYTEIKQHMLHDIILSQLKVALIFTVFFCYLDSSMSAPKAVYYSSTIHKWKQCYVIGCVQMDTFACKMWGIIRIMDTLILTILAGHC